MRGVQRCVKFPLVFATSLLWHHDINNIVDSEKVGGWKLLDPVWFSGADLRGQSFCSLFFCCLSQLYCPGLLSRALLVYFCACRSEVSGLMHHVESTNSSVRGGSEVRLILGNNGPVKRWGWESSVVKPWRVSDAQQPALWETNKRAGCRAGGEGLASKSSVVKPWRVSDIQQPALWETNKRAGCRAGGQGLASKKVRERER